MVRLDLKSIVVNGVWIVAPVSNVIPIPEVNPVECWNLRTWTRVVWQDAGLSAGKINGMLAGAKPLTKNIRWVMEAMRVRSMVPPLLDSIYALRQLAEIDRICLKWAGWTGE